MEKQKIFLWGTGKIAQEIMTECDVYSRYDVIGFIDNDINKQGKFFWDKQVFAPDEINNHDFDLIVILNAREQEIRSQIQELGLKINYQVKNHRFFYEQSILKRYEGTEEEELREVLDYIENNGLQVFNYDFAKKYIEIEVRPVFDEACGMFYVLHRGKKMYFAKKFDTEERVKEYYKSILLEQDEKSPHCYLNEDIRIKENDVVVDVGVAEGNFSLEVVDSVSKLYLLESDSEWIDALRETFKDYSDKVEIIQGFVSSIVQGNTITLDSVIHEKVNFIKMDIEGHEWDALIGAKRIINESEELSCAICAYHSDYDEVVIKDILRHYGMECYSSKGYMWFPEQGRKNYISTKLCRGIVYGGKNVTKSISNNAII